MSGGEGGGATPAAAPPGEYLTVTVTRDEHGYGMKVSGDNPVYVQSVKERGAAWRAGLRAGDRIVQVGHVNVQSASHTHVVQLIRANPEVVLTICQSSQKTKSPTSITAPVPVDPEKQRQLELSKVNTFRMMLEKEQQHVDTIKEELTKVYDLTKQQTLIAAEQRCQQLQIQIESLLASLPNQESSNQPSTPKSGRHKLGQGNTAAGSGFRSVFPRSLSNLTSQSIRNLKQARQSFASSKNQEVKSTEEHSKIPVDISRKKQHNNTVPMVPVTCLDGIPPPLPPRTVNQRRAFSPTSTAGNNSVVKPTARQFLTPPASNVQSPKESRLPGNHKLSKSSVMERSYQSPKNQHRVFRRSAHSLDEADNNLPNSIATQRNYPLVTMQQPLLQTDVQSVMHVRSQSSPEHLDQMIPYSSGERWEPPPGTPPPPYTQPPVTNTISATPPIQPHILSMEDDDEPTSENTSRPSLFSNLRSVRESKARMAVLLNWLLGERRSANAALFLLLTDAYSRSSVNIETLRRWAYELHSTFLIPDAVLPINNVDENLARNIDDILVKNCEKEEFLKVVFRKARAKAKDELEEQLREFQVKRQVGLSMLYGPEDAVLEKCDVDRAQETTVVEKLICGRMAGEIAGSKGLDESDANYSRIAALHSAAVNSLGVRPSQVNSVLGSSNTRATFLQRDKHYKQRVKILAKQQPQPFVIRGHHLVPLVVTSTIYCQHCQNVIMGLAPQAYLCSECDLRIHRNCWRHVEETCVADQGHNRISRLMDRIHGPCQDKEGEKKTKKTQAVAHFLHMEKSSRKAEDESSLEGSFLNNSQDRQQESDESLYESADCTSASEDTLSKLSKVPSASKESLKILVTDEENDAKVNKKSHRKTMSLSGTLEAMKGASEDFKKEFDKRKSRESLWSEDEVEKKKERRKSSMMDMPRSISTKIAKAGTATALSFMRRRKNAAIEAVAEIIDKTLANHDEIIATTNFFLEAEKRHTDGYGESKDVTLVAEDEVDCSPPEIRVEEVRTPRRKAVRGGPRNKSRVRGKSQTVNANPLKKSKSNSTLKRKKKKSGNRTPNTPRSRNPSMAEGTPNVKRKNEDKNSWKFRSNKEPKREGSMDESPGAEPPEAKTEPGDQDESKTDGLWKTSNAVGKPVSRAESCREPANSTRQQRGKQRNASDPNRLTANRPSDVEAKNNAGAPSGSSSSTSLSSRSNESNTVPDENHAASESEWSEEEDVLAETWQSTVPLDVQNNLSATHRKRQELIHELITSENSHVRWLKVLQKVFLRPLERKENSHLLSQDELKTLFPNLPAVRERHTKLYTDLRSLRKGDNHIVDIRSLADAVLNTLGEPYYSVCLSKFCRHQRLALDALREKRRKSKELHAFLAQREQLPLCGRLQLRDLMACVWQRLTKYQLLLENILKTVSDDDPETEEDVGRLKRALDTAKEVLHGVDAAIRRAENEHMLKTIQSKLVVQPSPGASAGEMDELRKLDLTQKTLLTEGELSIRHDNKRTHLTALFMADCLVLLQKEGDKYLLKHIHQSSQQALLSPLVKWDKVLFRPNAASKNTFFLMNINGIEMHELTANTSADYSKWIKYISEAPLADSRSTRAPSVVPSNSSNDEGTAGVSRNPSDASRTSQEDTVEEKTKTGSDRAASEEKDAGDRKVSTEQRPRPVIHGPELTRPLETPDAVCIQPPAEAQLARQTYSTEETLRRLNQSIVKAMNAKSMIVAELLNIPEHVYEEVSEMAVAETMGDKDFKKDLKSVERSDSVEREPLREDALDVHQILLAAQTQANQLTDMINQALNLSQSEIMATRQGTVSTATVADGLCDACHGKRRVRSVKSDVADKSLDKEISFDMLSELGEKDAATNIAEAEKSKTDSEEKLDDTAATPADISIAGTRESAASLASRLAPLACGLQTSLASLMLVMPALESNSDTIRRSLATRNDVLHSLLEKQLRRNDSVTSDSNVDQNLQDQSSNGG